MDTWTSQKTARRDLGQKLVGESTFWTTSELYWFQWRFIVVLYSASEGGFERYYSSHLRGRSCLRVATPFDMFLKFSGMSGFNVYEINMIWNHGLPLLVVIQCRVTFLILYSHQMQGCWSLTKRWRGNWIICNMIYAVVRFIKGLFILWLWCVSFFSYYVDFTPAPYWRNNTLLTLVAKVFIMGKCSITYASQKLRIIYNKGWYGRHCLKAI